MAARLSPRVFNIPASQPFLPQLIEAIEGKGLFPELDFSDPFALSRLVIYLPSRRACRALRETYLERAGGKTLLLPTILPLGEVQEDEAVFEAKTPEDAFLPDAVSDLERLLTLAQLTQPWVTSLRRELGDGTFTPPIATPADALALARELARFMDELELEGVSPEALKDIVPEDLSQHWSRTLHFLKIAFEFWPEHLAAHEKVSKVVRRNLALEGLRDRTNNGLKRPTIIAGSTGSLPATARFMAAVAKDPLGAVVLPGLDRALDEASFKAVLEGKEDGTPPDYAHGQYGLAKLIAGFGITRDDVVDLAPETEAQALRAKLVAEALRPASGLEGWHGLEKLPPQAVDGFSFIEAETLEEEALTIAVAMRHAVEMGESAVLITPDRGLARRVSISLGRWGLEVDDSAGDPLNQSPTGVFLRLVARVLAKAHTSQFDAAQLLALLKHPLCRLGLEAGEARVGARVIELVALRGERPMESLAKLLAHMRAVRVALFSEEQKNAPKPQRVHMAVKRLTPKEWEAGFLVAERLHAVVAEAESALSAAKGQMHALLAVMQKAAEAISTPPGEDALPLVYDKEAGASLEKLLNELCQIDALKIEVRPRDLEGFLSGVMSGIAVRPRRQQSPSLKILGLIEARLITADTVILAGLNEAVWPDVPQNDPFLSRPMRGVLGLDPPERRIGLAAHDLMQGVQAPRVLLTRAKKDGAGPTVPSRWWQRLDAFITGQGLKEAMAANGPDWLDLARQLAHVPYDFKPKAPAPCPPLAVRPRRASVTRMEEWIRNPYAIYARMVLRLEPLSPVQLEASAAMRGTFLHGAMEAFARAYPDSLPEPLVPVLEGYGRKAFEDMPQTGEAVFWWPRFMRAMGYFAQEEEKLFAKGMVRHVELDGQMSLSLPYGPFLLTARADRIDALPHGKYRIVDYKTGSVPSLKSVRAGVSPQLTLEASMVEAGGFAASGLPAHGVEEVLYIGLSGGREAGKTSGLKGEELSDTATDIFANITTYLARFDQPECAYIAQRMPQFTYSYDDYAHLARVQEWYGAGEEEGGYDEP